MANKILEEIFPKDGKFIDKEGKKVMKVNLVGIPRLIHSIHETDFYHTLRDCLRYGDEKANAFLRGEEKMTSDENNCNMYIAPIQLYEIKSRI